MKKIEIEIEIPERINSKDGAFSYCLDYIKKLICKDEGLKGNLSPLGDTELISMDKLLKEVNIKLDRSYTMDDLGFHMRQYEKKFGNKIRAIKKYSKITNTKVFIEKDLGRFKLYLLGIK